MKRKIAILGGGCGSMAAAWALTHLLDYDQNFERSTKGGGVATAVSSTPQSRWRGKEMVAGYATTAAGRAGLGMTAPFSVVQPIVSAKTGLMQQTALLGLTTLLILVVIFLVVRGIPQSTRVGSRGGRA